MASTPEEKTRRLIDALRRRKKFEGSDLALLQEQLDSIVQALWALCLCSFMAGYSLTDSSTSGNALISAAAGLLCVAFVSFFLLRLQTYSSAISLLISKNTFNLP